MFSSPIASAQSQNNQLHRKLSNLSSSTDVNENCESDLDIDEWDPTKTTFRVHAAAGSIAGVAEHTMMFPADTWKTFLQADVGQRNLRDLIKKDGITRLYRGTSSMLLGSVPAHAGYFTLYEYGKERFGANGTEHAPIAAGLSGAIATCAHDVIMTPMDVVKQRLQLGFHSGVIDCIRSIISSQGVFGLYRSFPVALSMNIPFASINVAANESFKRIINPSGEHRIHLSLLCGALAGGVAGALTTPLDVVRTRIQTQSLHPSQFKSTNPARKSGLFSVRRTIGPLFGSSQRNAGGVMVFNGVARAKYTRPMRCPLPIALWAVTPGTSTLAKRKEMLLKDGASSTPATIPNRTGIFLETVKTIWMKDGYRGFFRGLVQRVIVQAPAVAISWATYETSKDVLMRF